MNSFRGILLHGLLGAIPGLVGGWFIAAVVHAIWLQIAGKQHAMLVIFLTLGACTVAGMVLGVAEHRQAIRRELAARIAAEAEDRTRKQAAETAARIAQEQSALQLQRRRIDDMRNCADRALAISRKLGNRLTVAEEALTRAEVDLADGALSPFWDAIECAVNELAQFDREVRAVGEAALHYSALRDAYRAASPGPSGPPPAFTVDPAQLPSTPAAVADRLEAMVRIAHRLPTFATIYEQRRTNKILVEGFSMLAASLSSLAGRLESAVSRAADQIEAAVEASSNDLASHVDTLSRVAESRVANLSEAMLDESVERRNHEGKVREMLDNIQRRRIP